MKTLHLVTAVLAVISGFHSRGADFSAYNITQKLREKVQTGDYDIVDVRRDNFGGSYLPVVAHSAVREIVKELFDLDMIPDYTGSPFYDSVQGISYVKYSKSGGPSAVGAALNFVNAATAPIPTTSAALQALMATPAVNRTVTTAPSTNDDWKPLARAYVNRKFSATAKAIQSRLKGYPVTCEQIVALFRNDSAFDVTEDLTNPSKTVIGPNY